MVPVALVQTMSVKDAGERTLREVKVALVPTRLVAKKKLVVAFVKVALVERRLVMEPLVPLKLVAKRLVVVVLIPVALVQRRESISAFAT